jgi:type IV pilus assembly protein PilC
MPYFKWVGVNCVGTTKRGKRAASSAHDLSQWLFKRGIALMRCKPVYSPQFLWPITAQTKSDLFKQKAKLLKSGILLPTALRIVAEQSHNPLVHDILVDVIRDVEHGIPCGRAFQKHNLVSDHIVSVMLTAGHESGNIVDAIENVALYFHKQHVFNKNLRSVLAMPLLTLLFFMGISIFIFVVIIPRFADMFSSLQQELPLLTRYMIAASDFVCSFSMVYVLFFVMIIVYMMYRFCATRLLFLGTIIWQHHMGQALHALALLVKSGVPLVVALKIVCDAVNHDDVKKYLILLHDEVSSGMFLSAAMAAEDIFLPEIIALICVGEESGTLGHSLESAALVYTTMVEERLKRLIFVLQPVAIVLLGLLVATLIFAIYLPIMQLSRVL